MAQQIIMSEDGQEDLNKIRDVYFDLMNYGIMHEDTINSIEEAFLTLVTRDLGAGGLTLEMNESEDEYTDASEFLIDNYGYYGVFEVLSLEDNETQQKYANYLRDIFALVLYSDKYLNTEEIIEKIER